MAGNALRLVISISASADSGGWSTDRPARRFSGAPPFRLWFFPACRRQERVGPSAVRFFTSELVPWSCPPPPRRPSSPISPCKSRHQCPQVDRLLPPPSRQNNPAQPPRVLFLFQVTQQHSSLPFAAPAPDSSLLSQTSPALAYSVRTSCKSRPNPWQTSRRP